jgi:serine/threonine protein kinase
MVNKADNVKLIDFGLAVISDIDLIRENAGSPNYMAPEVFSRKTCAKSDIWAIGITLFNLVTGGKAPYASNRKLGTEVK